MTRLIPGARFSPEKTRQHIRKQDPDLSTNVDLLFENAGALFRRADPSGIQSYLLSCQVAGYKPRHY